MNAKVMQHYTLPPDEGATLGPHCILPTLVVVTSINGTEGENRHPLTEWVNYADALAEAAALVDALHPSASYWYVEELPYIWTDSPEEVKRHICYDDLAEPPTILPAKTPTKRNKAL